MMDIIQRNIVRVRGGRPLTYPYKTYPVIFQRRLEADNKGRLFLHLKKMFIEGMPGNRPDSPSQARQVFTKNKEVKNSDILGRAKGAVWRGGGASQHEKMQNHFLLSDPHTVAAEVPLYDDEMEGNADLIRIVGEKIEILDFKPDAHKCVEAAMSQGWYYRRLLHRQTGIALQDISFFAFDDRHCYQLIT